MSSKPESTADAAAEQESEPMIVTENLSVSYGEITALRGVDFSMNEGEVISVIGPNGAGKTTFVDTLTGFLPYEGSAKIQGSEVRSMSTDDIVEAGVIYCTESRDLFSHMDVEDNLRLGAYMDSDEIEERLEFVYEVFPALEDRTDQAAHTMSGGEQQMLAIGRALMGDPDLLVLDEPTIGLAPVIIDDISAAIDRVSEEGVTILLCEQNVTFALDHADHIYLLENGSVEREGTPESLQGDDYIRESYLGG